nr:MAG TPA_asm: hypothetical protein [Caudoviricetes sp.]
MFHNTICIYREKERALVRTPPLKNLLAVNYKIKKLFVRNYQTISSNAHNNSPSYVKFFQVISFHNTLCFLREIEKKKRACFNREPS